MKVCFFGSNEKGTIYSTLNNLLVDKSVKVIECQHDVYSFSQLFKSYFSLWLKRPKEDFSVVIILWRGIMTLPLAKFIIKKPIIFFPYVSIYDTLINDRKKYKKNSLQAKFIKFVERKACEMSDIIVLENNEVIEYFSTEYNIDKQKFRKLIWGADEKKFPPLPRKEPSDVFNVLYFGTFIPFHGVEIIVESARILSKHKDIKFTLCGNGQTKNQNEVLAKKYTLNNIDFLGHIPFSELRKKIEEADACLGIFGDISRRKNSFPNKISQVLASKRTIITRDVSVMKEMLLENKKNCILIPPNNAKGLAEAILLLKENPELNQEIATKGYAAFKNITKESWEDFWSNTLKIRL